MSLVQDRLVQDRIVQHPQPSARSWNRAAWIDAFVTRMGRLEVPSDPEQVAQLAAELHPFMGHLEPVDAADAEFNEWPPHGD